jgi:nucleoside-diphosphate kinase
VEKTFVLIKPDGVQRALVGRIIGRFEDAGLKVVAMKMVMADKELAGRHYVDDIAWLEDVGKKSIASYEAKGIKVKDTAAEIGRKIRGYLMDYLTSGPVVAMVVEGNESVSIVRKIVGSTAPFKADPSTIRGMYACDSYQLADEMKRPIRNLIHTSDSVATAEKEIGVWFDRKEIKKYKRADETAMFG